MDDHGDGWDPEAGTQLVAQRRERRHLLLIAGLLPLVGVLGAMVAIAATGTAVNGRPLLVVGVAVGLLVVLTGVTVGFIWWRRRRGSATFARSPLWELPSYRQRSRLVKALQRGEPIPPEVRPLAVRVAQDVVRRRAVVWLFLVAGAAQAVNVFVQDGWSRWLALAHALAFFAWAGYYARLRSRMRRALARLQS